MADPGEGTLDEPSLRYDLEAIDESVPANAIAGSLFARFASRQEDSFAMKIMAALRGEFGGHAIKEAAIELEK